MKQQHLNYILNGYSTLTDNLALPLVNHKVQHFSVIRGQKFPSITNQSYEDVTSEELTSDVLEKKKSNGLNDNSTTEDQVKPGDNSFYLTALVDG